MGSQNKEFKNLKEQSEILANKGLVINDLDYAMEILLRENYFFLSGYRHVFINNESNRFIEGTTFEELYSLFRFDRKFRNIIFKNLLIIENNVKSILSYKLSLKYGYREKEYLNPKNFTNNPAKKRQVNDLIKKMKRQIKANATQHSATMHYVQNYGYIPLWVLVKVLSFGIVGELYSILKNDDQISISEEYGLDQATFSNYIIMLSNYRNLCAHEDIVFENKTQRAIEDTKYHKLLNIPVEANEYQSGKTDIFALIIIVKQLLKSDEFLIMANEIRDAFSELHDELHSIKLDKVLNRMGFPSNWYDLTTIDNKMKVDKEDYDIEQDDLETQQEMKKSFTNDEARREEVRFHKEAKRERREIEREYRQQEKQENEIDELLNRDNKPDNRKGFF